MDEMSSARLPHSSSVPTDVRIQERLRLCQEQIDENPYSHTVAAGWYVEDIDAMIAKLHRAASIHYQEKKELEEQLEAAERKIVDYDRILQLREEVELRDGPINLTPVEG